MGNHAVASRERIRDAAFDLASSEGLAALSIRAVASRCNVAVGTVYNYYPTKSDLVNDVVAQFWRESFSGAMDILATDGPDDFLALCHDLSLRLRRALERFRAEFLADLETLDAFDLAMARKREEESFAHVCAGLRTALLRDPAVREDRLTGPLAPEPLCALVWETMVTAARRGEDLDETLLALLRTALYE